MTSNNIKAPAPPPLSDLQTTSRGRPGGGVRLSRRQSDGVAARGRSPSVAATRVGCRLADARLLRGGDLGADPFPLSAAVSACPSAANRRVHPDLDGCRSSCDRLSAFTLKVACSFAALRGSNHGFSLARGRFGGGWYLSSLERLYGRSAAIGKPPSVGSPLQHPSRNDSPPHLGPETWGDPVDCSPPAPQSFSVPSDGLGAVTRSLTACGGQGPYRG